MIKVYFPSLMEIRNLRKIIGRLELSLGFSSWLLDGWLHHVFLSILSLYVPLSLSFPFLLPFPLWLHKHSHTLTDKSNNKWMDCETYYYIQDEVHLCYFLLLPKKVWMNISLAFTFRQMWIVREKQNLNHTY